MSTAELHRLPSVERLVQRVEEDLGGTRFPRPLLVECARAVVEGARARLLQNVPVDTSLESLLVEVRALAARWLAPTLTRAVNATGVILHTNLGRAPLSVRAQHAVAEVMAGYSTLEVDLQTGARGSRYQHVESLLEKLTGAEAGLAVNNNAAAVLLALAAVAPGKEVIVSRGELVEIGGSFRLPDVMAQSGARLVEVGTTNRTYLSDYERAITPATGLLLKVHRSNFAMEGFVREVSAAELVELGQRRGVPVMYDVGSGAFVDLRARGLPYEPTVQDAVRAGCEIVTCSGDKLLGGPQAGIIVGRATWIQRVHSHPLARAVRMDKLDYAALAATLQHYLDPEEPWESLPVLRMLAASAEDLEALAMRLRQAVVVSVPRTWQIEVRSTIAEVGGGSLPSARLPSYAISVRSPQGPDALDGLLRAHRPPVFSRISDDAVLLDVRTLLPEDEPIVLEALKHASSV